MTKKNIYWLNEEKTVLLVRVPLYWEWHDMLGWLMQVSSTLDTLNYRATILFDFQDSTFVPKDAIANAHRILSQLHLNADPIVLARLSLAHRSILEILFRLYPQYAKDITIYDKDPLWLQTI